jgi:hypothetical protein
VADDDDDDKKSSWLQNAFGFVADKATAAGSALADAGSAVIDKVEDAGSAMAQGAQVVAQKVEDAGSTVVQGASAVVQKVEDTGSAVIQKVEDTGSAVIQKVEDTGSAIAQGAGTVIDNVENTASTVVQKVEDEGKSVAQAADNLVAELEGDASSAVSTVEQKIDSAIGGEAKKAADGDLNIKNKELKSDVIKLPAITTRAWGGRIVVQLLISFGFKATVSVPIDQLGKKVWDKWVADSGDKVITGGDLFAKPTVTKTDKDKKKPLAVSWETQAPIGKWTLNASAPSVGFTTGIKAPDISGGLTGTLIKLGHMDIEGASVDDIEITTSGTIDITLDMKVTMIRYLAEQGTEDLVKDIVEADAFVSAEVTALVLVAVGTIVGTINELTKAGEENELRNNVATKVDHFEAALRAGLTGSDTSPYVDTDSMAAFNAGKKQARDQGPLSAADADRYIATKIDAQVWDETGKGYWNKWMETHTGPSTFPEHAKLAWHACFQKRSGDPESDPDYQRWVKAKAAA